MRSCISGCWFDGHSVRPKGLIVSSLTLSDSHGLVMDDPSTSFPNLAVYFNYFDTCIAFEYEVTRFIYITTLGESFVHHPHDYFGE